MIRKIVDEAEVIDITDVMFLRCIINHFSVLTTC